VARAKVARATRPKREEEKYILKQICEGSLSVRANPYGELLFIQ